MQTKQMCLKKLCWLSMKSLNDIKKRYKRETIQQRTLFITDCGSWPTISEHLPLPVTSWYLTVCNVPLQRNRTCRQTTWKIVRTLNLSSDPTKKTNFERRCVGSQCCRVCSDCGSRTPGAGQSSRWHAHYTVCDSCYQQRNKGFSCPLCRRAYRAAAYREMVQCNKCKR